MLLSSLALFGRSPLYAPDGDGGGGGSGGNAAGDQSATNTDANANPGGQQGDQGGGQGGNQNAGVTFTAEQQAHIDRLIGTARKEGRDAAATDAQRKADEAAARAKGDFEKLANDRQARIDELEAEIAKRDKAALRAKVAAKHKLPEALSARLAGETEDELEADAKELAKLVGNRTAPDTEAGAGAKGSAGTGDRPGEKRGGDKTPGYTFDGKPKVAFPSR